MALMKLSGLGLFILNYIRVEIAFMKPNPLAKEYGLVLKACALSTLLLTGTAFAADKALLDLLLQNGTINQKQYDSLLKTDTTQSSAGLLDILKQNGAITTDQYNGLVQQTPAPASAPAPTVAAAPEKKFGVIRGKGGVTEGGAPEPPRIGTEIAPGVTATFGGFIEAASIYRSKNETQDVNSNFNTSIPFENNINAHQTEFRETARQSRISLLLGGDYDENTKLASYMEMDFLASGTSGNSNQVSGYSPRLRLGYATIDKKDWGFHFVGGQAWSLLTTNKVGITARSENIPLQIDGAYVAGFNYTRNYQLRFVEDFFDRKVWAGLSLESPQANYAGITAPTGVMNPLGSGQIANSNVVATNAGVGSLNSANNYSTDVAPDIIAKVTFDPGWGHYEMFGITRFFHSAITTNNALPGATVSNHTVESLGGGLAAILPVIPKYLDIQMNFMGGSGIGRYSAAYLPDAAFSTSGGVTPLTEYTALLGIVGHPTPNLDVYTYLGGEFIQRYNQNVTNTLGAPNTPNAAAAYTQQYGYGDYNSVNAGCTTAGAGNATCQAQTQAIWQITPGFWARLYDGDAGTVKTGVQYSYTRRDAFSGQGGVQPHTDDNMLFLSFRYYPLQK